MIPGGAWWSVCRFAGCTVCDACQWSSRIELAKGLAFVAVTSGLLYLLLDHWHASHIVQPANLQTDHHAPPDNTIHSAAKAA